jgi:hypothetical protein
MKRLFPFLPSVALTLVSWQATGYAQIEIDSARLELVRVEREYRDSGTNLNAARGYESGLIDFEVRFVSDNFVDRVDLVTPRETYEDAIREGGGYVIRQYADTRTMQGTYTIKVTSTNKAIVEFEFEVDRLDYDNFPEVEFPVDGMDRADSEDLEAEWDQGGPNRVDLFEIDSSLSDVSSDVPRLSDLLMTWRPSSDDQRLEDELFDERRYELWIGATEEGEALTDGSFEVDLWFTSSLFLRFTTGPDPRERIDGFRTDEFVANAVAGYERIRLGQTTSQFSERLLASLTGGRIREVEMGKIESTDRAVIVGDSLRSATVLAPDTEFESEIAESGGQAVLFLIEFRSGLLGSEVAPVDSALPFPNIDAPLSDQSGLGTTISVEWSYTGTADSFVVSLTPVDGGAAIVSDPLGSSTRQHQIDAVPANTDFLLEVSARSADGRASATRILVSTAPAGDVNSDGVLSGRDFFGFANVWKKQVFPAQVLPTPVTVFRLDTDGDERIGPVDLMDVLSGLN